MSGLAAASGSAIRSTFGPRPTACRSPIPCRAASACRSGATSRMRTTRASVTISPSSASSAPSSTMADDTNPQVSGQPSGSLLGSGVVRGTGDVTVNATDSGSGVYRVKLVVDDVVRLTRVVDANGGRCADVNAANDDEYEFADPAPCKTSAGGTYRFDTRALPEGDHTLQVLLEDAAGNSATLANRSVTVDNVPDPQPGGDGAGGAGGDRRQRRRRRPRRCRRRRRRRWHRRHRGVRRPGGLRPWRGQRHRRVGQGVDHGALDHHAADAQALALRPAPRGPRPAHRRARQGHRRGARGARRDGPRPRGPRPGHRLGAHACRRDVRADPPADRLVATARRALPQPGQRPDAGGLGDPAAPRHRGRAAGHRPARRPPGHDDPPAGPPQGGAGARPRQAPRAPGPDEGRTAG